MLKLRLRPSFTAAESQGGFREPAHDSGREIRYILISIDDFAAGAAEQGVPPEIVELLSRLFGEVLDGRNAHTADGVQRAVGREPRDFRDYARDAAASGVWNGNGRAA